MTYTVYAIFSEAAYQVATGNDQDHVMDFAERVCKKIGQWPNGFLCGDAKELKFNGKILQLQDLKQRQE